jgi:hypothetical protein
VVTFKRLAPTSEFWFRWSARQHGPSPWACRFVVGPETEVFAIGALPVYFAMETGAFAGWEDLWP